MPNFLQERVDVCYATAEHHFNCAFKRPEISLQLRGQKAGVAHISENLLRFNPVLYQENREHFLLHTVAHEVAHLLAYQLYGPRIRAHGPEWQALMLNVYQLPAQRCHNYAIKRTAKTHYLYCCECQSREPFALSAQRHARINKGLHYMCNVCGAKLSYTHKQIQR